MLAKPGRIAYVNNITDKEQTEAETQTSDAVKAALLISGGDKHIYGRLKNELGNNYLMGTDQYPDTTRNQEYYWVTINLHVNKNVINPEMMEELPSSR